MQEEDKGTSVPVEGVDLYQGEGTTPPQVFALPEHRPGYGVVTGFDLSRVHILRQPFHPDPFFCLRPPLSHDVMTFSLELAAMTYHLELDDWMSAGWTDFSIQIDNSLQSGMTRGESTSGEQMRAIANAWKMYRSRRALVERNPISQIISAFRQRERSDTIKAVTMLHPAGEGRYVVAIGFMGTGSRFYDWFSNFRFTNEEGFHKGFSQLAEYFEQSAERIYFPDTAEQLGLKHLTLADVLTEMKRGDSRFFLWMAGHSQGAAVMQVFCHQLITRWGVLPENLVGYGFASPTVATGQLLYEPARYPLYHVLNSDDVVPRMGALIHLGLCLRYPAEDLFRKDCYGAEPEGEAVREALLPFAHRMTNTLHIMEIAVAFCYCLLEEKGESSLATLADKRWMVAPIERALLYAGDRAQDVVESIARYAQSGYESLAGYGMSQQGIDRLKEELRPVVKAFSVRQLLRGLHDVAVPPHVIMRDHFTYRGAYQHIVLQGWQELRPFIWVNQRTGFPKKAEAQNIAWYRGAPEADAHLPRTVINRNVRRPALHRGVKSRSLTARKGR